MFQLKMGQRFEIINGPNKGRVVSIGNKIPDKSLWHWVYEDTEIKYADKTDQGNTNSTWAEESLAKGTVKLLGVENNSIGVNPDIKVPESRLEEIE